MSDNVGVSPTTSLPTAPANPPLASANRSSFLSRSTRFILIPWFFVKRKPRRAVTIALLSIPGIAFGIAVGAWVWFEYHLGAAQEAVDKWHNADAGRHLQQCRILLPTHRAVLLLSARVARRTGSADEAEALLSYYERQYGEDDDLALEWLLHKACRGDLEGTVQPLYTRISQGGSAARLARESLVIGFSSRFLWMETHEVLKGWLSDNPDDPVALLLEGKFLEQRRGYDDALKTYSRVLELDPELHEARLRLATLLVQKRLGDESLIELQILRVKLPENAEVQVLLAKTLALLGRTAEAKAEIDRCLAAHPNFPPALAERGSAALIDGDDVAAEEYLGRAARFDQSNFATRNQYALILARNGKSAEAANEYARIHQLEADADRIAELIQGPLKNTPNNPAVHHEIGLIALRAGSIEQSMRWFKNALRLDPGYAPTHRVLSLFYQETDNPILAAKHRALAQGGIANPKP